MIGLISGFRKKEQGSIIVFFALMLVLLLSFVSLAIDVGMVYMKKARMMDVCQQMRKARIDAKDYIMNADDPAKMIYEISNQCAIENGFEGRLTVYYDEKSEPVSPSSNWVDKRSYRVRIELQQDYTFAFAVGAFVGSGPHTITVSLDGSEVKTATGGKDLGKVPVWYPRGSLRTGAYERQDLTGAADCHYNGSKFPADW